MLSHPQFEIDQESARESDQENARYHLEAARENRKERLEERRFNWERSGVVIAAIMVGINSFILFVYLGQLRQMIRATETAERSANAARAAVDLQAQASKQSQQEFQDTLRQMQAQTAAQVQAAQASEKETKTARDALIQSQRPWVNAESFVASKVNFPTKSRLEVAGNLTVKNTGASVATDGWVQMVVSPNKTSNLSKNRDAACRLIDVQVKQVARQGGLARPHGFDLAPNQGTKFGLGVSKEMTADDLTSGFYLLGCAKYRDQFKIVHTTRFCFHGQGMTLEEVDRNGLVICNGFPEHRLGAQGPD